MGTTFADAKRAAILDAALSEFGEKGFASSSIQGIADRADVAKGTIYLYFKDKDELFAAAAERGWELFFAETERIFVAGDSPDRQFRLFTETGFERLKMAYPLLRCMLSEPGQQLAVRASVERLCGLIEGKLGEIFGADRGDADRRRSMIRMIVSGILFQIAVSPESELDATIEDARRIASIFAKEAVA